MKPRIRAFPLLVSILATAAPVLAAEQAEAEHGSGELARIVNFAVLATILVLVLRKPIANYVNAKADQIRTQLKEAKAKQEKAASELERAEALLKSLEGEVEQAKQEARRAAEAERDRVLRAAEQEAKRIRELAKKEIASEVEAGRRKLLARATELSVDLAHQKLKTSMTDADRKRLIDRSIEILGTREAKS